MQRSLSIHVLCLQINHFCTLPIKQELDYFSIIVASSNMKWCLTHHGVLVVEEGGVLQQLPLDASEVAGAREAVDGFGLGRPRPPVLAPRHLLPLPTSRVDLHLRVRARAG
uniref:Uncharacterized protein n=1 Tax=Arundo donax TaxID=35708 RepID=A0A0A9DPS6_ARUDO